MFTPEAQSIDNWIATLRAFAERYNLSNAKLAELAGLNKNTLNGFGKDGWNPQTETLRKLDKVRREYEQ